MNRGLLPANFAEDTYSILFSRSIARQLVRPDVWTAVSVHHGWVWPWTKLLRVWYEETANEDLYRSTLCRSVLELHDNADSALFVKRVHTKVTSISARRV